MHQFGMAEDSEGARSPGEFDPTDNMRTENTGPDIGDPVAAMDPDA